MFWRRKPLIGDELRDWIVDHFDWVSKHRPEWHDQAQLFTPTKAFFDAPGGGTPESARHTAENIKALLGLEAKIDIQPLNTLAEEHRHEYGKLSDVAGQFMTDGDVRLITYDPLLLRTPVRFIDTMCHELMHARLEEVADDLPGGVEMHELATDLHCIIAGFGLFQLEGHESAGWSGYLSQPSRAVALAMFLRFHDLDVSEALPWLSNRPAKWLKKAWADED